MQFARWSFALAAAYGLIACGALYGRVSLAADTQWLYVFAGAAGVTQLAYLLIAVDPLRYRMIIPIGVASKLSFAIPMLILYARGAISSPVFAIIDLALAAMFAVHFVRLGAPAPPIGRDA